MIKFFEIYLVLGIVVCGIDGVINLLLMILN